MTKLSSPDGGVSKLSPSPTARRGGLTGQLLASISLLALVLLVFVGLSPLSGQQTEWLIPHGSDQSRQAFFAATFGMAVLGCVIARGLNFARSVPAGVLLVLGWCLLTVMWSIDPTVSLRRCVLLAIVTATPFLNVAVLGDARTLRLLRAVLIGIVVGDWISVMFIANSIHFAGALGLVDPTTAWVGLHPNKNEAGAIMAIAGLLFALGFVERRGLSDLVWTAAAIIFLYFTRSKTSMGLLVVSLAAGAIYQLTSYQPRARALLNFAVGLIVASILIAVVVNASWLLTFLRDNPGLVTGRAGLWRYVLALLAERSLFGYGYGSVWIAETSPIEGIYRQGWTVWATHSHNGYLEVAIGTGAVGLVIASGTLIVRPLLHYAWPDRKPQAGSVILFSWLVFAVLHNFTEADLLMTDRGVWLVHAIVLACANADHRAKARRAQ